MTALLAFALGGCAEEDDTDFWAGVWLGSVTLGEDVESGETVEIQAVADGRYVAVCTGGYTAISALAPSDDDPDVVSNAHGSLTLIRDQDTLSLSASIGYESSLTLSSRGESAEFSDASGDWLLESQSDVALLRGVELDADGRAVGDLYAVASSFFPLEGVTVNDELHLEGWVTSADWHYVQLAVDGDFGSGKGVIAQDTTNPTPDPITGVRLITSSR